MISNQKATHICALALASLTLYMLFENSNYGIQEGFPNLMMCILLIGTLFLAFGIVALHQESLQRLHQLGSGEQLNTCRRHLVLYPIFIILVTAVSLGLHYILCADYIDTEYAALRLVQFVLSIAVAEFAHKEYRRLISEDLVHMESVAVAGYYTNGGITANSGTAKSPFANCPLTPISLIPVKESS